MKVTFTKINLTILLGFCMLCNQNLKAQDFSDVLQAPPQDAAVYLESYIAPGMLSFANGMAGGWYNTAKPHKPLGLDLTLSINVANVPESERVFDFNSLANLQVLELSDGSAELPTLIGGSTDSNLSLPIGGSFTDPTTGNTYEYTENYSFSAAPGFDLSDSPIVGVPVPTIQLGIGLIKNTDLKIRFIPEQSFDDYSIKLFGFGIMHDIKQWIPGIKQLPIDVSLFFGTTKLNSSFKIDEENDDFSANTVTDFEARASTFQVLVSKKISILTPYFSIGYNTVSSSLSLNGTYTIKKLLTGVDPVTMTGGTPFTTSEPINLNFDGGSSLRTSLGLRLKLAILTFHADYTIQKYNMFTAGIGLSIR